MPLILEKAPHVEFEDVAGIFIARFARPPDTVQDTAAKCSGKTSGITSGKTSGKILAAICDDKSTTIPALSALIGVSERSIERNIRELQQQGRLRRVGPAKGGHWELVT